MKWPSQRRAQALSVTYRGSSNRYYMPQNTFIEVKEWNCPVCTFTNSKHPYLCKICGHELAAYSIVNAGIAYKEFDKIERVRAVFGRINKILIPVLSCYTLNQFQRNLTHILPLTHTTEVSGVWLTTANTSIEVISQAIKWARINCNGMWIGVNLLGENIFVVWKFIKDNKPDGLWKDDSHISEDEVQNIPNLMIDQFARMQWDGLYFGGVLFKYTSCVHDCPIKIVQKASTYMDVLTTSGTATGTPIDIDKFHLIASNKGSIPMAVASGIDAHNVTMLKKSCNIYIVRTSIIYKNEDIDISKLKMLVDAIQSTD